ncbi:MAG: hypothetical protein WD708_08140 [Kiritimatiellia bacterium]
MIEEILLLQHSHYDRGYMHPPEIEDALQADYLREAIVCCESFPEFKWTSEVTNPVRCFLEECAARGEEDWVERLAALTAAGRICIGATAFHPAPLCDRRELAELVSLAPALRQRLGSPIRCAFQHDINGLPWPVVDAFLDAGVELLITGINTAGGGNVAVGRFKFFRWIGPSGRSLLVYNGDHYGSFNRDLQPENGSLEDMRANWEAYETRLAAEGHDLPFAYMTSTLKQPCDCNPPDQEAQALVRAWNREKCGPPIRYCTGEDLLERLLRHAPADLPAFRGDWTDWWVYGCASTPFHTSLARRGRTLLRLAERLGDDPVPARLPASAARVAAALEAARRSLGLWNEHTWGAYQACMAPADVSSRVQSEQKNALAVNGYAWARLGLSLEMERVSGNPTQARGCSRCMIVNPGDEDVLVFPRVPKNLVGPLAPHNAAWMLHLAEVMSYTPRHEQMSLAPVRIPAGGSVVVPLVELTKTAASLASSPTHIENEFLRLEFDAQSGRVLRLIDRASGEDLLPESCPWDFGAPVSEASDEASRNRKGPFRLLTHDAGQSAFLGIADEGHSLWLERSHELPFGHRVISRLGLGEGSTDLAVTWELQLGNDTAPNAVYAVFPTGLGADWRAWFDTAGQRVEWDAEQLPGANRDYITLEKEAEIADTTRSLRLWSPDVPLVLFGGFHFGRMQSTDAPRPAQPLLLSGVYNNYWLTNCPTAQPGPMTLHWTLRPSPASDPRTTPVWTHQAQIHPVF